MDWPKTVAGWVGLTVAAFAILGVGGFAGIWRWMKAPLEERINREREDRQREILQITDREHGYLTLHKNALKHDIDNVDTKLNAIELGTIDREARTRKLEERMRDSETDRLNIHREVGRTVSKVDALEDTVNQVKIDIIQHVQSAKEETLAAIAKTQDAVNETQRQVAVIDDRQRRNRGDRSEVE